ncbi:MFS transporter [Myxococcota bacterium]|nr:MFS transporter [Myxococcota bacterium]MBU1534296.1 MFS transporter [Myxococcota bacterium]
MTATETRTMRDSPAVRWGILILISLITFGTYYFQDIFGGIKQVVQAELSFTNTDFGMVLSAAAFANTFLFMIVLGGMFLDKFGPRLTGVLFINLAALGALITAYGASSYYNHGGFGYEFMGSFAKGYSPQLKMMLLGRILFGIGLETACVIVSKLIVKWFKGYEMALAFAINMAIGRIGSASALFLTPQIAKMGFGWNTSITTGAILALLGALSYLIYLGFDLKLENQTAAIAAAADEKPKDEEKFKFTDVFRLLANPSFLFIALLCVTFYSAVFPFIHYAKDLLENKFLFSSTLAATLVTAIPLGTIFFTPIFGTFVDKKGKGASLMILGSVLLIVSHLSLGLTSLPPYIGLFLLGVAFSLVPAAMWPSVAKIVDEKRLGTAYALMFTIQNWGLFFIPLLIGYVLDKTNPCLTPAMVKAGLGTWDYRFAITMLALLGFLGICFAFLLKRADKKQRYGLELPSGVTPDSLEKDLDRPNEADESSKEVVEKGKDKAAKVEESVEPELPSDEEVVTDSEPPKKEVASESGPKDEDKTEPMEINPAEDEPKNKE